MEWVNLQQKNTFAVKDIHTIIEKRNELKNVASSLKSNNKTNI